MRLNTKYTALLISLILLPTESRAAPDVMLSGDIGFGTVEDTANSTIQAGVDVQKGRGMLSLFGRVRLTLHNHDEVGVLRGRDWDEASDFVHIVRNLSYSRQFQTFNLDIRVGEIREHTIGHGSLMRDYTNLADPDHLHSGLSFRVAHQRFEVEGMLDNFVQPGVAALRGTVSPFTAPWMRGLKLGASLVMDPTAPVTVQVDAKGRRAVDSAYNLRSDQQVLALMDLDVSYLLEQPGFGVIEPYVDVATSFMGMGVHAGAVGQVRLGPSGEYVLGVHGEYHYASAGYAPAYMTTFHDVERQQAGLTFVNHREAQAGERNTKLASMARGLYEGHGGLVQVGLDVGQQVRAKIGYGYRPGPDAHQLWVRLTSQPNRQLSVDVLMMMRGIESGNGVANGVVAGVEGRYRVTDNIYGLAQYNRTWSLDERTRFFGVMESFNISAGYRWDS